VTKTSAISHAKVQAASQGESGEPWGQAEKFVANIGYGSVRAVIFVGNTLVLVPAMMHILGREQFALLALVAPLLRYSV